MKLVHFIGGPISGEVEHIDWGHDTWRVAWLAPFPPVYRPERRSVHMEMMYTADYRIRHVDGYYVGTCVAGCKDPYAAP